MSGSDRPYRRCNRVFYKNIEITYENYSTDVLDEVSSRAVDDVKFILFHNCNSRKATI